MAIRSFKGKFGPILLQGYHPKGFPPDLVAVARRRLRAVSLARDIRDLLEPPGNRLEKLRGNRAGQWSVRINDQWRICFVWLEDGAHNVEVVDYH